MRSLRADGGHACERQPSYVDNTAHEKYLIEKSRGCSLEEQNKVYSDELNILEENVRPTMWRSKSLE
jgi:hypothetical protein